MSDETKTQAGGNDSGVPRMKFVLGQEQEVDIRLRRCSTGGWEAIINCPPGEEWARVFCEDRGRCLDDALHYAYVA